MCDDGYILGEPEGVNMDEEPSACRTNRGEQLTVEQQDDLGLASCDCIQLNPH